MHASRVVGSDTLYEFNRGELEVSRYYPVGRRGVLAWRVRTGAIVPLRNVTVDTQSVQFVPPDQRVYGGGPHSGRRHAPHQLGPPGLVRGSGLGDRTDRTVFHGPPA